MRKENARYVGGDSESPHEIILEYAQYQRAFVFPTLFQLVRAEEIVDAGVLGEFLKE